MKWVEIQKRGLDKMTQAETKQEAIRQDKTRNRDEMRSIETDSRKRYRKPN